MNKVVVGTENLRGAKFSYDCKDFKLASQGTPCVVSLGQKRVFQNKTSQEGVTCKQEKVCPKKPAGRATTKKPGNKKTTTTTRKPSATTKRGATTTKKAGLIDRIKGSLGLGGTKSTTTTTRSLLSQSGALLTTKYPNTTTTTRPPFRG